MKTFLAISAILFAACASSAALADDDCPVESKAKPDSQCIVVKRPGGQRMIMLGLPLLDAMRGAVDDRDALKNREVDWDAALRLRDQEAADLRAANEQRRLQAEAADRGRQSAEQRAAQERDGRVKAEAQRDSLLHSPLFWGGVVIVVAGAAFGAGAVIAH